MRDWEVLSGVKDQVFAGKCDPEGFFPKSAGPAVQPFQSIIVNFAA